MASVEQEIAAIGTVLSALEPLSAEARASVLDYVTKRLGIPYGEPRTQPPPVPSSQNPGLNPPAAAAGQVHIKALKEQKQPKSAQEMAAVVAYYLSELAPPAERKNTINGKDVETYFKIAEFKLPEQPRYTLPNAKKAGYLDQAGDGEYRLNPVGYNLVVHSLPRGSATPARSPRRTTAKKVAKRSNRRA